MHYLRETFDDAVFMSDDATLLYGCGFGPGETIC